MPKFSLANPVLLREMRASLRNARAFALLALYVALLGAVVASNFPGDLSIDIKSDGGKRGQELFNALFLGQVGLILLIIPALATGALAQERERQTLQPLLLTPLSPLQIVWGKAGGVLSIIGLLLMATVPLTSLCFLLGRVDPGMLIAGYAAIFGLAAFTTGFGLYCAARWPGATRAMLMCYVLLPGALIVVVCLSPFGMIICGFGMFAGLVYMITQGWKRGARSRIAQFFGEAYSGMVYVVIPVLIIGLLVSMVLSQTVGWVAFALAFCLSYFLLVAHWGMLETARELMNRADAEPNMRQRVDDLKSDWQSVLAPTVTPVSAPANPAPSFAAGSATAPVVATPTPATAPAPEATPGQWTPLLPGSLATGEAPPLPPQTTPATTGRVSKSQTYGKTPFLSDRINPIFARELRSGLLGKWEILFRYSWVVAIASEVLLLAVLLYGLHDPTFLATDFEGPFRSCGVIHVGLTMLFGTWFGARAIAPEREGQTLEQLFTIPMLPRQIIGGKMAAVVAFTLYVWVLALPMALLLGMLNLVPWQTALWFPLAEAILGTLAAAWGIWCSFTSPNVRRALGMSLGGVATLLIAPYFLTPLFDLLKTLGLSSNPRFTAHQIEAWLPFGLTFPMPASNTVTALTTSLSWPSISFVVLGVYALVSLVLFYVTARNFQKLARSGSVS